MGSVGLGPGSKFLLWYGLGWVGHLVGWVEQIGPTDNSAATASINFAGREGLLFLGDFFQRRETL